MDSTVHARFFRVSESAKGVTDFRDILKEVMAGGSKAGDREREIVKGIWVRLEKCIELDDMLLGEFCRVQRGNFPPKTGPDGLEAMPLGDGQGMGHLAAFAYHHPTRVLLLQRNVNSVTVSRLSLYLASTKANRLFTFSAVLAQDAMERFRSKKPRGFTVTFAGPQNLAALDDADIPAAKAAKLVAEAYEGVQVKIEVTVGRSRKKWLEKLSLLADVGKLVEADGVKRLTVNAADGDNDEVINFLKEQLQAEQIITFVEGDHEANFNSRIAFLREVFSDNLPVLSAQFSA